MDNFPQNVDNFVETGENVDNFFLLIHTLWITRLAHTIRTIPQFVRQFINIPLPSILLKSYNTPLPYIIYHTTPAPTMSSRKYETETRFAIRPPKRLLNF